jgi:hypothetical protein
MLVRAITRRSYVRPFVTTSDEISSWDFACCKGFHF